MNTVLTVILIVLAAAAVWLVAEVAVTVRRVRPAVKGASDAIQEVRTSVNELAEQAKPVLAHVDEAVTQAQPAVTSATPLLEGATDAVTTLNADLERIEAILTDASRISGAASNATSAVQSTAATIADRLRTRLGRPEPAPREVPVEEMGPDALREAAGDDAEDEGEAPGAPAEVSPETPRVTAEDAGYFTYPVEDDGARR